MKNQRYVRYHIERKFTPNIVSYPYRFRVKVKRWRLAKFLTKELIQYSGNKEVILSRPCVYGVFSGPLGGFAPREHLCVGCLRCTIQYPHMVRILKNPERDLWGDSFFTSDMVATIMYESEKGRIPVKGMGFRRKFGGKNWDGMWTDMSEIVRPTRDGIHGREFISTKVDIGEKLSFLEFDQEGIPLSNSFKTLSLPIPILFDTLPDSNLADSKLSSILGGAATSLQTYAILPLKHISESTKDINIVPLIHAEEIDQLAKRKFEPVMIELEGWNPSGFQKLQKRFPHSMYILRVGFEEDLLRYYEQGVRIFHLVADYHGLGKNKKFILDNIRNTHLSLVKAGCRDETTLIGSGGIIAAEHIPKAILCGLDVVALNTPLLVALQAKFSNDCTTPENSTFKLPKNMTCEWGIERLKNLVGSWNDQLLEVLGAMGLREVRRMRGDIGRAMFQKDLENEAFAGISGYAIQD